MNLKLLLMKKGVTQIELSKKTGINPAVLSQQINLHRMLPEKHISVFCKELGITEVELRHAVKSQGGSNE